MSQYRSCLHVAHELKRAFSERGATLPRDVLEYLDSALGITGPEELAACLEEGADSDLASLLELIFFPDLELKIRLEPILQEHELNKDDEGKILDLLLSEPFRVNLYFPGSSKAIPVPLLREPAGAFIRRLRLDNTPPPELLQTINRDCSREEGLRIQVLLRSARFPHTRANLEFLQTFFRNFSPRFDGFYATFRYALAFLEELKGESDIPARLVQKKIFLEQTLDKALSQEKRLRSQSLEVLLMQKESILSFNPEELRTQLRIVDDLCASFLGFVPETDLEGTSFTFSRSSGPGQEG